MDFFERQDRARRSTKRLVLYFLAGISLIVVSVYVPVLLITTGAGLLHPRNARYLDDRPQIVWWQPKLFLGVTAATLAVIGIGCLVKTRELAGGGSAVAAMLGGRLISPTTTVPAERRLLNVVEEMAIAAGIPVPQVFLLPEEHGINAFAAGHTRSDAVVTVTAGALDLLNRDELQGVIGHEFSHILNGDMALNMNLMGGIFGIMCLAIIGRILLQVRPQSRRDRGGIAYVAFLGLALLIIGWIGIFFGRLIQAAVSRQREFLADASSVQFTRNPEGLSRALQKIGRYSFGSHIESPQAEQASHLFFSNGMSEPFFRLLATHPPIPDRIRAIDPTWDGTFPPLAKEQVEVVEQAALAELAGRAHKPSMVEQALGAASPLFAVSPSGPLSAEEPSLEVGSRARPAIPPPLVVANAGSPTMAHLRYAETLRNAIPEGVRATVRDPLGACTIVYALLFSDDEAIRSRQMEGLGSATSDAMCQETARVWPEVREVAAHARLPLVNLALPGLRHLSPSQFQQFRAAMQKLVEADGQIDLFEYVLQKIVLHHLEPQYVGARRPLVQYYALNALTRDCEVLLSALAYVGQQETDEIQSAFQSGAQMLSYAAQVELHLLGRTESELACVDGALDRLAQAVPQIKKNVLEACARVVAADGVIQEMEAELLRAIADTLDCPLPPFVAEESGGDS